MCIAAAAAAPPLATAAAVAPLATTHQNATSATRGPRPKPSVLRPSALPARASAHPTGRAHRRPPPLPPRPPPSPPPPTRLAQVPHHQGLGPPRQGLGPSRRAGTRNRVPPIDFTDALAQLNHAAGLRCAKTPAEAAAAEAAGATAAAAQRAAAQPAEVEPAEGHDNDSGFEEQEGEEQEEQEEQEGEEGEEGEEEQQDSRYLYPSRQRDGRYEGVSMVERCRHRPWQAQTGNWGLPGVSRHLGNFRTELAAAAVYAAEYEARFGTARREDDTADFTTCQSAWEHLIGIMPEQVDKLGVDFSITSLSPDHPSFWSQLAARTWHGEGPPSSADIQRQVDEWTADRSADQIMACLLSLWKDEASTTAGGLSVLPLAPCCPLQCVFRLCACTGAVGELLTVDLAASWPCIEAARDVSQTEGKNHTSISHDVRGVISPSACGADQLAALVPLHPVEGTAKRELFIEAKYTSLKDHRQGSRSARLTACCSFGSDPTGTLVVITIVLRSARCMVQLAMAGSEVQKGMAGGKWQAEAAWTPSLESLGRAEVRLLRHMLSKGWLAVRLIGINRPCDASVPLSQVYG